MDEQHLQKKEEIIENNPEKIEGEAMPRTERSSSTGEKTKKCFLHSAWLPLIFWLVFTGVFYFFAYDLATIKFPDIADKRVISIFSKYSIYAGLILGLLSMLGGYIFYAILRKTKLKNNTFIYPLLTALMALPWYLFARQLVYFENRYTDIARGVINYIGYPLLSTAKFIYVLVLIWLIVLIIKLLVKKGLNKKVTTAVIILLSPMFLNGCIGDINEWACSFFDDPDHCYQNAGVQEGDTDTCAKIKGEGFNGSNPPRDKCYLRIAENTGDLSACDKIQGGLYSYTKEECILGASVKFKNPEGCLMLSGADKKSCVSQVGPYLLPGSVLEIDDQINILKEELKNNPDAELQKQLDGLEKKRNDYLGVMDDKNKKDYESLSDPMNKKVAMDYYSGRIDQKTKDALTALNDSLRGKGEKLSDQEYKSLSEMLAYKNDPKNDIENMDPSEIVKLRWNEKFGNAVDSLKFWNSNPTEAEKKYDEQLLFYQRMLERQAAIEKGLNQKQQDFGREADRVTGYIKDQIYDKIMDEAKKQAFGELLDLVDSPASAPVTAILGEAIDTVKKEAQSAEFRGLVRAYNKGMEEELCKFSGNVDKAHAAVTANLQKDPYMYEDKNTFAKYGNILENKDCDGSNPHCIQRDVFWKAMKKSYTYQNK